MPLFEGDAVRSFFAHLIPDLLLIIGFSSLVYGAYLIYHPAAFIVAGMILISTFRPITNNNNNNNNTGKRKT